MTKTIIATTLALLLPVTAQAETKRDAEPALSALEASLANADRTLALVQAQEALNRVYAQEAISALNTTLARAEVTLALVEASDILNTVNDTTLLAELQGLLDGNAGDRVAGLITAVVSERPGLAPEIQDMALTAGYGDTLVAAAIISGLGTAPATAAGQ